MSARPQLLLAVDTSSADAGLALAGAGWTDTFRLPSGPGGSARTEDLADGTSALLAARSRAPEDLTLLGAVVGPGSYTGLRSGLAFLRGLAFADSLPAVAVGTLELLAWRGARAGEAVVAVVAAGSGRYAAATYAREPDDVRETMPPALLAADDWRAFLADSGRGCSAVVSEATMIASEAADVDAAPLVRAVRAAGMELRGAPPDALEQLARLVVARAARAQAASVAALLPIYVGQAHARPNRHRVAVFEASE